MFNLAEALRKVAILASPFIAGSSKKILEQLGIEQEDANWDNVLDYNAIKSGTKVIKQGEPLFVRLDKEEEIEYIKNAMHGK